MTPEQFAYWLQGFVELGQGTMPTEAQWKSIQDHLQTVFKKVTPPISDYKVPTLQDMVRNANKDLGTQPRIFPPGTITC